MTIQEMKKKKQELGYTNKRIAELSGVPLGTVQKIFGGATKSPRYDTIRAITQVLRPQADVLRESAAPYRNAKASGEASVPYRKADTARADLPGRKADAARTDLPGRKGSHTLEDYYALPDDRRAELIDGVFYDMATPTYVHQALIVELAAQLKQCTREHGMPCWVFVSPCDVQLDADQYTMVQPDLLVLCDPGKLSLHVLSGAPDFIIECSLHPPAGWI